MGVRRYRSVGEMPGPPPLTPLDPDNLRLACELMELARTLGSARYDPGVRRFATHDELTRERERRVAARLRQQPG